MRISARWSLVIMFFSIIFNKLAAMEIEDCLLCRIPAPVVIEGIVPYLSMPDQLKFLGVMQVDKHNAYREQFRAARLALVLFELIKGDLIIEPIVINPSQFIQNLPDENYRTLKENTEKMNERINGCSNRLVRILQIINSGHADLNKLDRFRLSPLKRAAWFSERKLLILKSLLKNGARIDTEVVHSVVLDRGVAFIKELLALGIDFNAPDKEGKLLLDKLKTSDTYLPAAITNKIIDSIWTEKSSWSNDDQKALNDALECALTRKGLETCGMTFSCCKTSALLECGATVDQDLLWKACDDILRVMYIHPEYGMAMFNNFHLFARFFDMTGAVEKGLISTDAIKNGVFDMLVHYGFDEEKLKELALQCKD